MDAENNPRIACERLTPGFMEAIGTFLCDFGTVGCSLMFS